ncbi:hypothetical protein CEXT_785871 [Caerostris extrusa]|uniref:Uncharacterized protein n=1 Tax=Caerostris extrusa TaxID=172846 RepID=A0AAV4TU08_CAEEX|nr:hypothetical protein CEXT_785871 [Caerostris extrusa]
MALVALNTNQPTNQPILPESVISWFSPRIIHFGLSAFFSLVTMELGQSCQALKALLQWFKTRGRVSLCSGQRRHLLSFPVFHCWAPLRGIRLRLAL